MKAQTDSYCNYSPLTGEGCFWRSHAERIVEVCEATIWSDSLEAYYSDVSRALTTIFDCNGAFIFLLSVTGNHLTECASFIKYDPDKVSRFEQLTLNAGRLPELLKERKPVVMDYLHPNPKDDIITRDLRAYGMKSAVNAPLFTSSEVLGFYSIVDTELREWSETDMELFLYIGRVLGAAIQRAQFFQNNAQKQIFEERRLLSAEIHDTFAHMINSMRLEAEATMLTFEKGDHDAVMRGFKRQEALGRQALTMLRAEMQSLRTPSEQTGGLLADIDECLERFTRQWSIEAEKCIELDGGVIVVSIQTELQLVRIINECLTNILRHSAATHVDLTIRKDEQDQLHIVTHDNGCGFSPEQVPSERLGIKIMKERAHSFGGELVVESVEDQGTTVSVVLPHSTWQLEGGR